jgi:hypothetical protein
MQYVSCLGGGTFRILEALAERDGSSPMPWNGNERASICHLIRLGLVELDREFFSVTELGKEVTRRGEGQRRADFIRLDFDLPLASAVLTGL